MTEEKIVDEYLGNLILNDIKAIRIKKQKDLLYSQSTSSQKIIRKSRQYNEKITREKIILLSHKHRKKDDGVMLLLTV